ncbi:tRNA (adenosine(37)-N6)-dimethylallyltransferase MiaA [Chitinophaga pendula]|uniref:tRNA (adenosine(37)-N6)-dimethylallyltransferase MiaA n=1 Tax=Chitinophaga TaxID=79328 RepID=UPI000BB08550|nr:MULTISPECIES: tRNA (adenosine(37)-N6)-dimethylallyltransferase MiaA [Chitinophaga]ASZ11987.1 tRNA (adenosine(37)-N6)-dimethylallyltransferase MiaA [Chitinophaga sp. MD30]UCJ04985.1 tRNA (adenosine(37)-N6)-dimethylallyltransferase MiaA [Chitinophaga pendula]
MQKTVIILAGPTASGKTALAIKLAQLFNTAVISADSRQCYREISIGTAKPAPEELQAAKHYFINSHSIQEEINAGIYEKLALQYTAEIFASHNVAIMCGGTGLYIKAFTEGMDDMPAVPPGIREAINIQYNELGIGWLQQQLQQRDPQFYNIAETQNPQRLIRALEILEATGQSITTFRKASPRDRDFRIIKIGITLPKELLHQNIHHRVDLMINAGLVDEVRNVLPFRSHNALQTVGYQEIFSYLDGNSTLEQAVTDIKTHTRQYAKRQLTWFRKDPAIQWFDARETQQILHRVQDMINNG